MDVPREPTQIPSTSEPIAASEVAPRECNGKKSPMKESVVLGDQLHFSSTGFIRLLLQSLDALGLKYFRFPAIPEPEQAERRCFGGRGWNSVAIQRRCKIPHCRAAGRLGAGKEAKAASYDVCRRLFTS
mmetsp:Transcript_34400/g.74289  ORF Transcript_34400/g.74289 Transcript_34400/m.74289 type:complete len:129 (+) Transcript_34400:66-452(+)